MDTNNNQNLCLPKKPTTENIVNSFMPFLFNGQYGTQAQSNFDKVKQDTSAMMISLAARLELESITLKQDLNRSNEILEELTTSGALQRLKDIQTKLKEINQKMLKESNQRICDTDKLLMSNKTSYEIEKKDISTERIKEDIILINEKLTDIGSINETIKLKQDKLVDLISEQNNISIKILESNTRINTSVDEIKQFLQLLLSRFITLESFVTNASNSTNVSQINKEDDKELDKKTTKKRKLI
ncbi:uncharacterized protein KGF55_002310 [Candida pseudojiufengensis]|uniref:uncharacterized protein n=1 Tax=Candida pseudojiufengensis TaxID=497109 RepID=UPI002224F213|nr:uncharacterized protein KGF55_002310 [Candida pseudojiufengensis]KAI5964368.1 hypothetical protein KGF55_002310 [Candida pseudojiufengensis]